MNLQSVAVPRRPAAPRARPASLAGFCNRGSARRSFVSAPHLRNTADDVKTSYSRCLTRAGPVDAVQAFIASHPTWLALLGAAVLVSLIIKAFSRGSRKYDANVGQEYDAWTKEGILEHYWGEHIHLGYYSAEERQAGFFAWGKKNFIQARSKCPIHCIKGLACCSGSTCSP
jgi:hypothetical protein